MHRQFEEHVQAKCSLLARAVARCAVAAGPSGCRTRRRPRCRCLPADPRKRLEPRALLLVAALLPVADLALAAAGGKEQNVRKMSPAGSLGLKS